jgi:hypothetical protein
MRKHHNAAAGGVEERGKREKWYNLFAWNFLLKMSWRSWMNIITEKLKPKVFLKFPSTTISPVLFFWMLWIFFDQLSLIFLSDAQPLPLPET